MQPLRSVEYLWAHTASSHVAERHACDLTQHHSAADIAFTEWLVASNTRLGRQLLCREITTKMDWGP